MTYSCYTTVDSFLSDQSMAFVPKRHIPFTIIALLWCIAVVYVVQSEHSFVGYPLDDAWIHMVYGRGTVDSGIFHYNPNDAQTGTTSPLWSIILALVHIIPLTSSFYVLTVKLLGLFLLCVTTLRAFGFTRDMTGSTRYGFFALGVIALDPLLIFSALSGMEVTLCGLILLEIAIAAHNGKPLRMGCLILCAVLTRPENILLIPLIIAFSLFRFRDLPTRHVLLSTLVIPGLGVLLWALYCYDVSGHLFPSTFLVKKSAEYTTRRLLYSFLNLGSLPWVAFGAGLILFVPGVLKLRKFLRASPLVFLLLAIYPWLFWISVGTVTYLELISFYFIRYLVPVYPLFLLSVALGLAMISSYSLTHLTTRRMVALTGWVVLAAFLIFQGTRFGHYYAQYGKDCRSIQETTVAIGQWINSHVPPEEYVVSADAGAVRYFGNRPVIDLLGLNSHQVLKMGASRYSASKHVKFFALIPCLRPTFHQKNQSRIVFESRAMDYSISEAICHGHHVVYFIPD